jgi:hypothetical protein
MITSWVLEPDTETSTFWNSCNICLLFANCLTVLYVTQTMERRMVWCWWRMKWNGSLVYLIKYYPGIFTERLRKTTKTSARATSVPAGIWPGNSSNTCQNHYRLRQLDVFRSSFFSDITPYCPSEVNGRFEETHRLNFLLATCFILVSFLAYSTTLNIEAICSFQSSVGFQRHYVPEDRTVHNHRCEVLKSYSLMHYLHPTLNVRTHISETDFKCSVVGVLYHTSATK